MKSSTLVVLWLLIAGAALTSVSPAVSARNAGAVGAPHAAQLNMDLLSNSDWKQYDRAIYVVSSLNVPLCSHGRQLLTVLRRHDGARRFDVLHGATDPDLFFVQVRASGGRVLAVYAYKFGQKLPLGVWKGMCVHRAPDATIAQYRRGSSRHIVTFLTRVEKSWWVPQ